MRRAIAPLVMLAVLASCSAFENRRIVQYATAVETSATQTEARVEADKMSADQAETILVVLEEVQAHIKRYWRSKSDDDDYTARQQILDAIKASLARAAVLLTEDSP